VTARESGGASSINGIAAVCSFTNGANAAQTLTSFAGGVNNGLTGFSFFGTVASGLTAGQGGNFYTGSPLWILGYEL
jgi:hypothetical protein